VIRQFVRHRCLVRASALSYSTLIALIPLLAVALSLTSSLLKTQDQAQFQHAVEKFVASVTPPATISTNLLTASTNAVELTVTVTNLTITAFTNLSGAVETKTNVTLTAAPTPVVTVSAQKAIANQIWGFVQNAQSAKLGGAGVVLLLLVAISLLGRIEETFNDIWGVTRGRNWLTQIQLYSTTIMLGPLLMVIGLGLAGGSQFQAARDLVTHMPVIGKLIFQLLPVLVLWLAFTFVYQLVPNTKVNFSAAFVGGAVAGTLWYLNNVFGFLYVSRVISNVGFYGGLGLVPVFMIGLYFSWIFLLLGAQIAYAFQNRAAYLQDRLADNVNQRGREFVALRIMTTLGQRFQNGRRPATVLQLSTELGIPSRLTTSVLRTLAHKQLVTEVSGVAAAYVPARPLETINAYDILNALRTGNGQELPLREETMLAEIYGEFARIEQAERHAAASVSLLALARRMPATVTFTETNTTRIESQIADAEIIAEPHKATAAPAPEEPAPGPVNFAAPNQPESVEKKTAARRDVVMPEENREFPL
jgi:membrane protein